MADRQDIRAHLQYLLLFHNFKLFLERAAEVGIDVVPLKGAHFLTAVYSTSEHRGLMADIDFLVRGCDFSRACRILEAQGYMRLGAVGRRVTNREFHEAAYVRRDLGIMFEPHACLVQPARHRIDYDALWDRTIPSTFEGVPCRRLTPEDHFLHGAVHLMSHRFIKPERSLRDLELLLRRASVDLSLIVSRSKEWEVSRSTWLTLVLLDKQAPDLGLATWARRVRPPLHVRVLLRRLVSSSAGLTIAQYSVRKSEAVLWPLLFDRRRQALRFASAYLWLRARDRLHR